MRVETHGVGDIRHNQRNFRADVLSQSNTEFEVIQETDISFIVQRLFL